MRESYASEMSRKNAGKKKPGGGQDPYDSIMAAFASKRAKK